MLRLIPRHPFKVTAKELHEKLLAENYITTKRTVERDLMSLSESFPIVSDERDKPYGWSWLKDGVVFDLPGISNTEALTFNLVEQHLKPILPASTLAQLEPYFATSTKKLASLSESSIVHTWLDKVRVVQPTQALLPAVIDEEVQRNISEALLRDKQLKVTYKKRGVVEHEEYLIHPLGLVVRGQVIYLVCTFFDYQDIRILALNRIKLAEMLVASGQRPRGFKLDDYITAGAFGFGGSEPITLEVLFRQGAGNHLYETAISQNQKLTLDNNGNLKLTASVINTEQLRWWLLGFGENAEVIRPTELRNDIAQTVQAMRSIYND